MSDLFSDVCEQFRRLRAGEPPEPSILDRAMQDGRITCPAGLSTPQRAMYLWYAGDIAHALGRYQAAAGAFEALVVAEEQLGEPPEGLAASYARLGKSLTKAGATERALAAFAQGEAVLGGGLCPFLFYSWATALLEQDRHHASIPHWATAAAQFRDHGDAAGAAKAMMSLAYALLEVARARFDRGEASLQAGASEDTLEKVGEGLLATIAFARRTIDDMLSDPELAPHTASMRTYARIQLSHAYAAIGQPAEALAQLQDLVGRPDTADDDLDVIRERIAELQTT